MHYTKFIIKPIYIRNIYSYRPLKSFVTKYAFILFNEVSFVSDYNEFVHIFNPKIEQLKR